MTIEIYMYFIRLNYDGETYYFIGLISDCDKNKVQSYLNWDSTRSGLQHRLTNLFCNFLKILTTMIDPTGWKIVFVWNFYYYSFASNLYID